MLLLALRSGSSAAGLTLVTGGIGAAFLGHAVTRFAVFLTTGHAGQPPARPRGRGDREAPADARGLAGRRTAGVRVPGPVTLERPRRRRAAGRAVRPRPVLRLALPVLRLRRLRRARRRAVRRTASRRSSPRSGSELELRADALDARVRAAGPRQPAARDRLPRRWDADLLPRRASRVCSISCASGSGSPTAPR